MKKTFKKRAFISAIAMLIVSAIVLTSATYAWFSMAKRVEVESMELNVTSPEGIQISANTTAFTTKLTVDNIKGTDETAGGKRFNAYEGHINNIPTTVKPSSSTFTTSNALPACFDGFSGTSLHLQQKEMCCIIICYHLLPWSFWDWYFSCSFFSVESVKK